MSTEDEPRRISDDERRARLRRTVRIARRFGFVGRVEYRHVSSRAGGAQYGLGASPTDDLLVVYADAFERDADPNDFSLEAIIAHDRGHQILCRDTRLERLVSGRISVATEEVLASLIGSLISERPVDRETDLPGANLTGAILSEAHLSHADLRRANLRKAFLMGANLSRANLVRANLIQAALGRVNLLGANLSEADLSRAIIGLANFSTAILRRANFDRAYLGGCTFADNDLSEAKGLETAVHLAPSYISIDTIYKSNCKIPEVFLRGCGVTENFIAFMRELVASEQPIQFYSCFISCTEKDDAFSERLYNDLQAAGVRCWRWREDATWGRSIWGSVDEAVRPYDKLVVVCSKHSLGGKAPAVLEEIDRALTKEDEHARAGKPSDVLFPITLDDFIFNRWEHERRGRVLKKHIGDFRKCKAPTAYQAALKRLIRDLAAEPAAIAKKGK